MTIFLLAVGIVLIVSAFRNSYSDLFSAIGTDIPNFVVIAAAILAIGIIGYVPTLKPVSKGLLALVIIVLVLNNYQKIIAGFQDVWQNPTPSGGSSVTSQGQFPDLSSALNNYLGSGASSGVIGQTPNTSGASTLSGIGDDIGVFGQ